jgi:hypothetical protein
LKAFADPITLHRQNAIARKIAISMPLQEPRTSERQMNFLWARKRHALFYITVAYVRMVYGMCGQILIVPGHLRHSHRGRREAMGLLNHSNHVRLRNVRVGTTAPLSLSCVEMQTSRYAPSTFQSREIGDPRRGQTSLRYRKPLVYERSRLTKSSRGCC